MMFSVAGSFLLGTKAINAKQNDSSYLSKPLFSNTFDQLSVDPVNLPKDEIVSILSKYNISGSNEITYLPSDMLKQLYGKWKVGNSIGYSLKYDITGGQLDDGEIYISAKNYEEVRNAYKDPLYKNYLFPVFISYNATLDEMAKDEMLNYSGIEGVDPKTIGTVVLSFGLSDKNTYDLIPTKFLLINEYVIAVHSHSFYQLDRVIE